jgi:hypothetical protein
MFFQPHLSDLHHYNLIEGFNSTLAFKIFGPTLTAMAERIEQPSPPRRGVFVGYSLPQPNPDARSTAPGNFPRLATASPTKTHSQIAVASTFDGHPEYVLPVYSADTEMFTDGNGIDWPRMTVGEPIILDVDAGRLSHAAIPTSDRTQIGSSNASSGHSLDERPKDPLLRQAEIHPSELIINTSLKKDEQLKVLKAKQVEIEATIASLLSSPLSSPPPYKRQRTPIHKQHREPRSLSTSNTVNIARGCSEGQSVNRMPKTNSCTSQTSNSSSMTNASTISVR